MNALLLSGGIDSIAVAYWKRPEVAVTVDYGQVSAAAELAASAQVARELRIEHITVAIDCSVLGSGDMAGARASRLAPVPEWWPFRNQLLVSFAAALMIERAPCTLNIGTVASDAAHADGGPSFVDALSRLLLLQEGGIDLVAPAIEMTSPELVRRANVPIEILAWAHSCHVSRHACGRCRGCVKHYNTMSAVGFGHY